MPTKLEIVTPEGRVFTDTVDYVSLPGSEGELGILPLHSPLVTTLKPGELHYSRDGKTHEYVVGEGLVEVTAGTVRILTDVALQTDGIDEAKVQEALERAKARLQEKDLGDEEVASVEALIARSTAQLHFKRKRRSV